MSNAKENILRRLRGAAKNVTPMPVTSWHPPVIANEDMVTHFKSAMTLAHTQIIETSEAEWPAVLMHLAQEKNLQNWLISTTSSSGQKFSKHTKLSRQTLNLILYDQPFESMKETLFYTIDASLTEAAAAIADTGTLLLLPSIAEPRTMSLVPPVHVALLRTSSLVSNFNDLIVQQQWPDNALPTNALLISGPSKTADIQQTLAYGAHGPKALIVLLIRDIA